MPNLTASSLFELLSAQDLLSKQIELEGLFHCSQHEAAVRQIIALCDSNSGFRFPDAEKLLVPLRSNFDGELVKQGKLHEIAVRSMLTEVSNWHLTISKAFSELSESGLSTVLTLGPMECISTFIMRGFGPEIVKLSGAKLLLDANLGCDPVSPASANADLKTPRIINPSDYNYPEHAVAIVGMACKFPGASSLDEFWQVLTSGTSMAQRVPAERFSTEKLRRSENSKTTFWGNFVSDVDAFDHRFFKKSSREAVSMDPQQRLLLEVAYEAMASSGYFGDASNTSGDDTGCFLGVGAADYSDNVASHPANAFSAVGTLRAFLSGKISHYFGWTGPSITYDTACSSSAVALHAACRAIAGGECSRALAGGANLITSPNLHQNLMAASFLSLTGATKSFDAKADGYCRGEGVGLVVLKRLTAAVAAGDVILGVIAGSAVNQNNNATSITVPYSSSQIDLYKKVSRLAGIDPLDVSYVEAHGTGTPVGDPIEYESIREVFGGPQRSDTLFLGSVKANIGHTEAASGAAALIKTVLMLQHAAIPVQPNFTTLNPKIRSIASDNIEIPLATQSWVSNFRAACINNYGAAGSNAAMIVCQPPSGLQIPPNRALPRYPIFISAHCDSSLIAFCGLLKTTIARNTYLPAANLLSSIAFNLAEKQNRTLPRSLITTAATLTDLSDQLSMNAVSLNISQKEINHSARPVVLAFSGQTSNAIGLSEDVYAGSTLFRSHLDRCDAILRSFNLPSLYPGIFSTEPIEDLVTLHCMFFSFQYACAMSWIDSGLRIDTLVGHSFGQLTALSISGTLSVSDALRLVSGRACLMRDRWGPERGSMIHIEGGIDAVQGIISSVTASGSHHRLSVACYNATSSHVLVGPQTSIDAVERLLAESRQSFQTVRSKRLNTSHGFHSEFTEPFLLELSKLAEQLVYCSATIPLETCSDWQSWTEVTSSHIAEHTRQPVYFEQAVRRISKRLGPCTWLGVGPGTSITSMISRALINSTSSLHIMQPVQLENPNALGLLAESTANLWRYGHRVQFWPFHRSQSLAYSPINLPPYQFEKSRHWLKYIDAIEEPPAPISVAVELKPVLLTPL
jgi:acyl transferase domain-containing protein